MKSELVVEKFADMIIERMKQMKASDWKKGWIGTTFGDMPINLRGSEYNGTNSFLLLLLSSMNDWKYPVFATFHQIKELGGNINKACYLDSWISALHKEPKFIVSVLADVNKAVQMILEVVSKEKVELVKMA